MRSANAASPALVTFVALLAPSFAMGTDTTSLALDPLAPNTVYAGTADSGVYKSTNGGATWSPHGLTNTSVRALVIDPGSTPSLYALTPAGVLKNSTEGDSWSAVLMNEGLVGIMPYNFPIFGAAGTLAIAPRTDAAKPGVLYVGVTSTSADAFTEYVWGEVYGSSDGGSNWWLLFPAASGDPWAFPEWRTAPVLGAAGASALASATIYTSGSFECDLMWFHDWGPTVPRCPRLGDAVVGASAIVADSERPEIVYFGTRGSGVYKTIDAGVSWIGGGTGVINSLAIDQRSELLYAGTDDLGVLKSMDAGATWRAANTGLLSHIEALGLHTGIRAVAVDPLTAGTVYAATAAGVFKSTDGGENWTPTGLFQRSALASFSVSPSPVIAGAVATGTVTLSTPAAAGGTVVTLSNTNTAVTNVPADITVPAGATTASFAINTSREGVPAATTISATLDDASRSATLYVVPAVRAVVVQPGRVAGGLSTTGTVSLGVSAEAGGAVVSLSSSDPAIASVPAAVTVAPGAESANFTVSTSAVVASTTVTITADYGGWTKSTTLQLVPTTLVSLQLQPDTVVGGNASTATVTLSVPAPAGGAVVALFVSSSGDGVLTVPTSVTVGAGATSATFVITTSPVLPPAYGGHLTAGITAEIGGTHASSLLTVIRPPLAIFSLSLNPASVTGGATASATATLTAAAPAGGAAIAISSSNPAIASTPASVTVPWGSTSVSFPVSTQACTSGSAMLSGSYGGVTTSAGLTVTSSADGIAIQVADYFTAKRRLRLAATSTNPAATLNVYVTSSGKLIGTLQNLGGGKYSREFAWSVNPQNVTVRSSQCGSATAAVRKRA